MGTASALLAATLSNDHCPVPSSQRRARVPVTSPGVPSPRDYSWSPLPCQDECFEEGRRWDPCVSPKKTPVGMGWQRMQGTGEEIEMGYSPHRNNRGHSALVGLEQMRSPPATPSSLLWSSDHPECVGVAADEGALAWEAELCP